jgi:glyoxylase-like metal-dependent hydrolase (beta-lactamase superfamily II)
MHCLINYNNEKIFFAGDLIPAKEWLHLPVAMGYDRCAETLVDEKKVVLERALKEAWKILFTHDPKVALCEVAINSKGKYEAINAEEDFIRKKI